MEFDGGVAVVTGAASGIGLAIARGCAARGMSVALADIEHARLEEAGRLVAADGAEVLAVTTDVADRSSMEYLGERVAAELGDVRLLVNNAGVGTVGPKTWELDLVDWRWVLEVNLFGVINGLDAFLPGLVDRDVGHVVNTASAAGLLAPRGMAPYVASKHAIVSLSEALRHELAAANSSVGVSVLCPGLVATRMPDNERNRPAALQVPADQAEDRTRRYSDARDAMRKATASASDPSDVANRVLDAVARNEFYVITDTWIIEAATQRFQRIIDQHEPIDPS